MGVVVVCKVRYNVEICTGCYNATQYIIGSQHSTDDQYRKDTHFSTGSQYSTDYQYRTDTQYNTEISDDDPFTVLPADLKNFEKLGADLYFNLLVKVMLYCLLISLSLPAIVPMGKIILALYNLGSLWLA